MAREGDLVVLLSASSAAGDNVDTLQTVPLKGYD
jgi:hypothetical protein